MGSGPGPIIGTRHDHDRDQSSGPEMTRTDPGHGPGTGPGSETFSDHKVSEQ